MLRSDKLCVDEAELVQAARNWARVGAVSGTWARGEDAEAARAAGTLQAGGGARAQGSLPQAVLEQPVAELAAPVVRELRLALLSPAELSALEEQNRREPLIPVRTPVTKLRSTLPRGDEDQGPKARTSVFVVTRFPSTG